MKLKTLIFCFFLLACSASKKEIPEDILTEEIFINILKQVHLAQANFELQKTKGIDKAKNKLANVYRDIYSTYHISEEEFQNTLSYYSENPEKLEEIYAIILEQLTEERTNLNP